MIKIGDIVKLLDATPGDHRSLGTVMRCNVYESSSYAQEPVIEVAWSSLAVGWVLESRLEVVCEAR
jgi:hypothetical protein